MTRARLALALAVCIVAAMHGRDARAQSSDSKQAAIEHFERAEAHLAAREYDAAIREYKAAYEQVPKPGFYYNIARAYELKGDKTRALEFYLEYIELEPNGPAAAEARTRAVNLEHAIADEQRAAEGVGGGAADPPAIDATHADERPSGRGLKLAGAGLGGAGLVLVGAAVYFGLQVSSAEDDLAPYYAGERPWDAAADDLEAKGNGASLRANVLYGLGAGAIVGGAILYYAGWNRARAGSGAISMAARAEGGVTISWSCEL